MSSNDPTIVPSTLQLFAPQPVKPRRRQKSLESVFADQAAFDSAKKSKQGNRSRKSSIMGSDDGSGGSNNSTVDEMDELFAIMKQASIMGGPSTTSASPSSPGAAAPAAAAIPHPPVTDVMDGGSQENATMYDWSNTQFYAFPSPPVVRNCRNPMIFNPAFQEKNAA